MNGRVVLVGAGHAHLEVLRQAARFKAAGLNLILIEPGEFTYSGAASAVVSGQLGIDAIIVDPALIANGFEWRKRRVTHVDFQARRVTLDDGTQQDYTVLSLNTGSQSDARIDSESGGPQRVWRVKPLQDLIALSEEFVRRGGDVRLCVVGAGASGVELAMNFAALQRRLGAPVSLDLVGPEPLLPGWPARAGQIAQDAIARAGIIHHNTKAVSWTGQSVSLGDASVIKADAVLLATGLTANLPLGLPQSRKGLSVGPDLAWQERADVFAVGDCAYLSHAPRPALGVFGVRCAPVLIENLIQAGLGKPARKHYQPQSRWLTLIDMGDGTALGRYGSMVHRSSFALGLKRWLDHRFVQRYQRS